MRSEFLKTDTNRRVKSVEIRLPDKSEAIVGTQIAEELQLR